VPPARTTSLALVALLSLSLPLAGCLSAPTETPDGGDGTGTVEYTVSNAGEDRVQVVVAVVPPGVDTYRIEFADGRNRTVEDVPNASAVGAAVPDDAVAVVPVGEGVIVRRHTLAPGTGVGASIESVPADAVVVQSLGHPDGGGFRGLSVAYCADASLTRIELDVGEGGNALRVTCADATATTAG
jgi:hypothetical protein